MDIVENELATLKTISNNFRKAPNRQYTKNTLLRKLNEIQTCRRKITDTLQVIEDNIPIKTLETCARQERLLTGELINAINQKLLTAKPDLTLRKVAKLIILTGRLTKDVKMASLIDMVKTVSALLPTYDGTPTKLNSFIDALAVVKQITTTAAHLPTVIAIVMTKLEGKARHVFNETPTTIDEITTKLKQTATPTPPETIIAKLANCKQRANITGYTKEIEELTMLLEAAYISKEIPPNVAQTMATKEGVRHLSTGLKDEKTAIIVKAGQYKNISEAINRVLEEAPTSSNEVTIQYATSYHRQNAQQTNFRGNRSTYNNNINNHYRGTRRNYRSHNNRYFHDHRGNGGNRDTRGYRNENSQRAENNRYRSNRGRNGNFQQRNIFLTENASETSEYPRTEAYQTSGETTLPNRE